MLAAFGAILPDLDRHPPMRHRRTLHNPILPFILPLHTSEELRSIALGYMSHIVYDALELPVELVFRIADEWASAVRKRARQG